MSEATVISTNTVCITIVTKDYATLPVKNLHFRVEVLNMGSTHPWGGVVEFEGRCGEQWKIYTNLLLAKQKNVYA